MALSLPVTILPLYHARFWFSVLLIIGTADSYWPVNAHGKFGAYTIHIREEFPKTVAGIAGTGSIHQEIEEELTILDIALLDK